jgi:hypothetical protein
MATAKGGNRWMLLHNDKGHPEVALASVAEQEATCSLKW